MVLELETMPRAPLAPEEVTLLPGDFTDVPRGQPILAPKRPPPPTRRVLTKPKAYTSAVCRQVAAAMFASLSSVSIGFITAYSSLTLTQIRNDTSIEDYVDARDTSWIASLPSASSILGSLLGGFLMDIYGPRQTLVITALPCVVSWGLIAFAHSVSLLHMGRFITGIFLGIFSPVPQVYAAEIAEPRIRGLVGAFPEAAVALGSLLCYAFGSTMHWRYLAVTAACLPGFPLFMAMAFLPESPQWLTKKNRLIKAEKSLKFFREDDADVNKELTAIKDNIRAAKGENISVWAQIKLFRLSQNWRPVLIVFLVFMCGQFSGFAVVTAYTGDIFEAAGASMSANTSTIIVGVIRFLSTLISAFLLDKWGRRFLLVLSAVGSSVGMVCIGIFFYFQTYYNVDKLAWLPLASLLIYVFFNELGYGPIPWLLSGELIPLAVRTLGNGIAVTAYSLFAFGIGLSYPTMLHYLSPYVTFWLYGLFSLSGVVLGFLLPETKGRTLEEIERYFIPEKKKKVNKALI